MARRKSRSYKTAIILQAYDQMSPEQRAALEHETWLQALTAFFRRISAVTPTRSSSTASGSDKINVAKSSRD